jgi:hypothetical protein
MGSPPNPEFERLIARVARELKRRDFPFMIIGGQAVLLHGEPRLTQDVDVTLGATPVRVLDLLTVCRSLALDVLADDPELFARRTFVLPAADPSTRIRVDFISSTTPYERLAIERAVVVEVEGELVGYAAPEDLILHKLFAGRARDLEDARGVVARKGPDLDWGYIERWALEFSGVEGKDELPSLVSELRRSGSGRGRA